MTTPRRDYPITNAAGQFIGVGCGHCAGTTVGGGYGVRHEANCPTVRSESAVRHESLARAIKADKHRTEQERQKKKAHEDYWARQHGRR